ncbi:murein biosynthesis integral membrane protein MurJ [Thermotoga profunda]|uniref:murein biosynthesis integral membrane protein MurJ n=1 Tax=Thermotoga profunda TaxID=1508420 RepID=UPI000597CA4D|nr:murein biosynthesis integral membrane protein MurJ [Thermotoga profunda]
MTQMLKYGTLFAIATLISRVTGLLRDVLLAHKFGAGIEFDAYVIAISFPFLLRRAFAEGAMTSAFVPLYNEKNKSNEFASSVITVLGIVTVSLTVLVEIFPGIVPTLLSGGANEQTRVLVLLLARISMPFIVFIFLWAVLYAIQNSYNIFFIPALSPTLMNIGVILGTLSADIFNTKIIGPTLGFTLGGLFMFISLVPASKRVGFKYKPSFAGIQEFLKLFFPALLAMTVSEFNVLIDVNVASLLGPGNVSAMQYANRFYQLPFGVFGVAMATVVLPMMVNESEKFEKHLFDSVKLSLFLTVPSMLGLMILSKRLIILVYQHGAFTYQDTLRTSIVLFYYSIGLPLYSIMAVLSRACHARKDMKTPFKATLVSFIVNGILDFTLGLTIGVAGIALATSIAGFCGMMYLVYKVKPKFDTLHLLKITLASIVMVCTILIASTYSNSRLFTILLVLFGIAVYMLMCRLLKVPELRELFKLVRR